MEKIHLSRNEIQLILDTRMALSEMSNSFLQGDPRKTYFKRLCDGFLPILHTANPELFPQNSR